MASVRKKPDTKYWFACITNADGVQEQRSTRMTNKGKALLMANEWEQLYRSRQVVTQARKVIADICAKEDAESSFGIGAEQFLLEWLRNHSVEIVEGSRERYNTAVTRFIKYLKERERTTVDIAEITTKELIEFRNKVAEELSAGSANTDIVILRIAFGSAVRDKQRSDNPASGIAKLNKPEDRTQERRPFTEAEIQQLMLHAKGEMIGMVLFAIYSGQRLSDIARLCWGDIELPGLTWKFKSKKAKRHTSIPLGQWLKDYLADLMVGGHHEPIFPEANAKYVAAKNKTLKLSAEFHNLMVTAGLVAKRSKANTDRGHSTARKTSEITFHCFRHNATSWLKAAGVPESVVRDIIGHESALISRIYTHIEDAQKSEAITKLDGRFDPLAKARIASNQPLTELATAKEIATETPGKKTSIQMESNNRDATSSEVWEDWTL